MNPRLASAAALAALAALATLFALAPPAAADAPFVEGFEDGLDAWTVTGSGLRVECGDDGCALRAAPPCCSAHAVADRDVSVRAEARTTVSFRFLASFTGGNTDLVVEARLANGAVVKLTPTHGQNNGLALSVGSATATGGTWRPEGVWFGAAIVLDPIEGHAHGELRAASGALLGKTATLTLPEGAIGVESLRVYAVNWDGVGITYLVDDLRIERQGEPDPPPRVEASLAPGGIALQWSSPQEDGLAPVEAYRIHRSTRPGEETFLAEVGNVPSFEDMTARPLTTYYYTVTAVNAFGESAPSEEASPFIVDAGRGGVGESGYSATIPGAEADPPPAPVVVPDPCASVEGSPCHSPTSTPRAAVGIVTVDAVEAPAVCERYAFVCRERVLLGGAGIGPSRTPAAPPIGVSWSWTEYRPYFDPRAGEGEPLRPIAVGPIAVCPEGGELCPAAPVNPDLEVPAGEVSVWFHRVGYLPRVTMPVPGVSW